MISLPIIWQWDGEALRPATKYQAKLANEDFVVGQRYRMIEEAERSDQSHKHEFAWLREAWKTFPEDRADELYEQFPSPDHLRKFALIKKGYCTMKQYPCTSRAEAERLRAALKEQADEYALIVQRDAVVTVYTAVSQSRRAMGGPQFQASKTAIMEFVGDLLGVDPETLGRQTEAA